MSEEFKYERQLYQDRLKFEHELINRRITWLLTSQTILLALFGIAIKAYQDLLIKNLDSSEINNALTDLAIKVKSLLHVVPKMGLAISILIMIGIVTASLAKWKAWKIYTRIYKKEFPKDKNPQWAVNTCITKIALIADWGFPIIFAIAWICIYNKL